MLEYLELSPVSQSSRPLHLQQTPPVGCLPSVSRMRGGKRGDLIDSFSLLGEFLPIALGAQATILIKQPYYCNPNYNPIDCNLSHIQVSHLRLVAQLEKRQVGLIQFFPQSKL